MLKTKLLHNVYVVAVLIVALVAMYGFVPVTRAASLDSVKDTVSDSSPSAQNVTHTIVFNAGVDLTNGTVVTVTFNANFDLSDADATCPSDATAATSSNTVTCTVNSTLASTTDYTITATGIDNPSSTGSYDVTVSHNQTGNNESSQTLVYIVDQVSVTASVDAILTFSVATTTPQETVNSESYTGTSSPTAIAYGTLSPSATYLMGHTLTVSTNAKSGFVVTVEEDQNLQTAAGADIDSFSTTSPAAWSSPTGDVNDESTWGHMGVTSDDTDYFSSGQFQGLDGTNPLTVFSHNGPVNGSGTGVGTTKIGYKIEITSMQEAGDYSNTLTYICTPTY